MLLQIVLYELTIDSLPLEYASPVLYGISAMGTKLCFYEFKWALKHMSPHCIPSNPDSEFIIDTMPAKWWDCDVLEAGGEQRLQALVTQIMEACAHLQN